MDLAKMMAQLPEPPDGKEPYWEHWRHELWELAQKKEGRLRYMTPRFSLDDFDNVRIANAKQSSHILVFDEGAPSHVPNNFNVFLGQLCLSVITAVRCFLPKILVGVIVIFTRGAIDKIIKSIVSLVPIQVIALFSRWPFGHKCFQDDVVDISPRSFPVKRQYHDEIPIVATWIQHSPTPLLPIGISSIEASYVAKIRYFIRTLKIPDRFPFFYHIPSSSIGVIIQ